MVMYMTFLFLLFLWKQILQSPRVDFIVFTVLHGFVLNLTLYRVLYPMLLTKFDKYCYGFNFKPMNACKLAARYRRIRNFEIIK